MLFSWTSQFRYYLNLIIMYYYDPGRIGSINLGWTLSAIETAVRVPVANLVKLIAYIRKI